MGPFELMDLIGIDVNYQAMLSMYEQTWGEPRYRPHWIQRQKVMQNTLGRKSGQGFYNYSGKNGALIQPELPRQKKTPANILISPGSWVPGINSTLEDAGFRLESQLLDKHDDYLLAIIPASRRENLKDLVVYWDSILPTRIPILVQACETTISETISWLKHPERVAGFDGLFFSSGHAVTLVAHSALEESTQNRITNFISNLGKLPIWITDTPGLILPRIVSMLVNEAAFALLAGIADDSAIDMAMQLGANYPLGPLTWGKSLGYPTVLQILDHLYDEYHEERYRAAPNIRQWDRTKP